MARISSSRRRRNSSTTTRRFRPGDSSAFFPRAAAHSSMARPRTTGRTTVRSSSPRDDEVDLLPHQQRIRIDIAPFPPPLVGIETNDGEMQMRRVFRRVAGRADIAEKIAAMDRLAFVQASGVAVEMRVVVAVALVGI